MNGRFPKWLDRFLGQTFDYVIAVCDRADGRARFFREKTERSHWTPGRSGGTWKARRKRSGGRSKHGERPDASVFVSGSRFRTIAEKAGLPDAGLTP